MAPGRRCQRCIRTTGQLLEDAAAVALDTGAQLPQIVQLLLQRAQIADAVSDVPDVFVQE